MADKNEIKFISELYIQLSIYLKKIEEYKGSSFYMKEAI